MFFVIVRAHIIPAFSTAPSVRSLVMSRVGGGGRGTFLDDSKPAPAWQHSSGTRSISSLSALAF